MRLIKSVLALVLAILGHAVGVQFGSWFTAAVDLFLVVTVVWGLSGSVLAAMAMGTAAGWLRDALSGGPFGLFGTADTIVAFAVAVAVQRLVIERPTAIFCTAALAALAQALVLTGLTAIFAPDLSLPSPTWWPLQMFTTGVLVLAGRSTAARLVRRIGERRRRRGSRLRFE